MSEPPLDTVWYCLVGHAIGLCDWQHVESGELTQLEQAVLDQYPPGDMTGVTIVQRNRFAHLENILHAHMTEHGFTFEDVELIEALSEPRT